MEVKFDNAEVVIDKKVTEQGVVVGLKNWKNRTVKIVVIAEE